MSIIFFKPPRVTLTCTQILRRPVVGWTCLPRGDAHAYHGVWGRNLVRRSGTLFTIGRTTVFWRTPVVRPPYDMRGYSRRTSYVRRPCAGRKFRRKSTTSTEMSYDLLSYAYIWKTFLFLPFSSFLVRYTKVTSFCTSPQHLHRVTITYNFVPYRPYMYMPAGFHRHLVGKTRENA